MEKRTIIMERAKETKNTFRYEAVESDEIPTLTTVYLPKWFVKAMNRIKVTVEPGE